jgi:SAM-dependent methyltransferase
MPVLTAGDFAGLFGGSAQEVTDAAGEMIAGLDLAFAPIVGPERDAILLEALRRIHAPTLKTAGKHREPEWESGWRENLDEFRRRQFDPQALVPKYVKPGVPIRLSGVYIKPALTEFVYHYTQIFRAWLFRKYLAGFDRVCEFGCGTGQNLVHLGQMFPDKQLLGCDWARSSQELLGEIRQHLGLDITGRHFDFFQPDAATPIDSGSAVLTFGALEQLGDGHGAYLDFLIARRPALCLDVIGIHELYDESDLVDYLGLLYHQRRNYLQGYLTKLRALAAANIVEIINVHHHRFGNYFDDPYSYVAWRPK